MSQGAQGTAVMPAGMSAVQPPVIEAVLPAVSRALADELGSATPAVRVVRASRRDHSLTWELEADRSRYILKWLPRRASRELELARLTRDVFAGDPGIRTPRVACNPTADTFLVEKLPGVELQSVCTVPPVFGLTAWVEAQCRTFERVGRWLRGFHDAGRRPGPAPLDGMRVYLKGREAAFEAIGHELSDTFWRQFESMESAAPARVHGDFTPHNVLVSGETVAVIDLAGITEFEVDTPCFDAAAMMVGVEEAWRRRGRNPWRLFSTPVQRMLGSFLGAAGIETDARPLALCYAARHVTRVYNMVRRTGSRPGSRNWHIRRIRLALERPEAIRQLGVRE